MPSTTAAGSLYSADFRWSGASVLIATCLMVAFFSREKEQDERVEQLKLKALRLALPVSAFAVFGHALLLKLTGASDPAFDAQMRRSAWPELKQKFAALFATLAGALLALWLRYTGPDATLSFEIMLDILLIVVIGGMGTVYGAVVGAVLFVLAQNYLQDLLKLAAGTFEGVPVLGAVLTPDRWLLWLGVLFVLSVYHFPTGVVGRLRAFALKAKA